MRRILLSVLILVASASAMAREVKLSSADGGSCADTTTSTPASKKTVQHEATPHEARIRPSVHGDMGNAPRMRWHSFLPGMFR